MVLTFDDGPGPETVALAEYLRSENVTAAFFAWGRRVRELSASVVRLLELGHVVGNHSENHLHLTDTFVTDEAALAEFDMTDAALAELGVPKPRYFRPPYGAWNAHLAHVFNAARRDGAGPINWDIDGGDHLFWRDRRSPEECAAAYVKAIEKREAGEEERVFARLGNLTRFFNAVRPEGDAVAAAANRTCSTVQLLVPRLRDLGYSFLAPDWISESKRGID